MEELKQRLLEMQGVDNFQRVYSEYPIPFYIGLDNTARYAVFCIVKNAPAQVPSSSKIISVFVGQRRDGYYGITFSLGDRNFFDHFAHFCADIIHSAKSIKNLDKAGDFVCSRYVQWQKAFARTDNGLLSASEIKGLIGELCFLQSKLIPEYGEADALKSWCGPEMTYRDFELESTWFEVKATTSGSATVTISSVEQLDADRDGHLAVLFLDKTSIADTSALTLNKLYQSVRNSFSTEMLKDKFDALIMTFGYFKNPAYDKYCYRYKGMSLYTVDASFPCMRKTLLPIAAQNVRYDLSLAAIATYKED